MKKEEQKICIIKVKNIPANQILKQGILQYYTKGKVKVGIKIVTGAIWKECNVVVTKDGYLKFIDKVISFF